MDSYPVYILAGGRSSRFGTDKARAVLDGQPLISRLASIVSLWGMTVSVVADVADKYADLGLRTIADRVPGRGPVGGLHAAVCDLIDRSDVAGGSRATLLFLSCDMVELRPHWIEQLGAAWSDAGDSDACAFQSAADGRWHPMPGLYSCSCLPIVQQALSIDDARHRSMQALLGACSATAVGLPEDWPAIAQVNTPDELARVSRSAAKSGGWIIGSRQAGL